MKLPFTASYSFCSFEYSSLLKDFLVNICQVNKINQLQ